MDRRGSHPRRSERQIWPQKQALPLVSGIHKVLQATRYEIAPIPPGGKAIISFARYFALAPTGREAGMVKPEEGRGVEHA